MKQSTKNRPRTGRFRQFRILVLLLVLLAVALQAWLDRTRTTQWQRPVRVVVYPSNGDGRPATNTYIRTLQESTFDPVEDFIAAQAATYGVALDEPVVVFLGPTVAEPPPPPPRGGGVLDVMLWSLQLRYWAWSVDTWEGPAPHVRLFVTYYDAAVRQRVPDSLGLNKGLIAVANAFAADKYQGSNQVVMTHELLHTLGASDKYDLATNQPLFPIGYADPDRQPRYPQQQAELMGGRIPVAIDRAVIPEGLQQVMIGPVTALEIRWLDTLNGAANRE